MKRRGKAVNADISINKKLEVKNKGVLKAGV